jgi:hypothetical protein
MNRSSHFLSRNAIHPDFLVRRSVKQARRTVNIRFPDDAAAQGGRGSQVSSYTGWPFRRRAARQAGRDIETEIEIPHNKLKWDKSNPTGHGIVFLSRTRYVFCYVQPGGV